MDVSEKPITARTAIAQGQVRMKPETLAAISAGISSHTFDCLHKRISVEWARCQEPLFAHLD
jgi:hypothetical protein